MWVIIKYVNIIFLSYPHKNKKKDQKFFKNLKNVTPEQGLEPWTVRLKA